MSDDINTSIVVGVAALWAVVAGQVREHTLRKEIAPKLSLVAAPEREKPTVTTIQGVFPKIQLPSGGMKIHGVGIVNSGLESSMGVRVRLMRIEPPELTAYSTTSLHVANEPVSVDSCDVHHALRPVRLFEVVSQYVDRATGKATALKVRVAGSLFEREIPLRDRYFFTLAIDGPRAGPQQRFVLQLNEDGQYEMRQALYTP